MNGHLEEYKQQLDRETDINTVLQKLISLRAVRYGANIPEGVLALLLSEYDASTVSDILEEGEAVSLSSLPGLRKYIDATQKRYTELAIDNSTVPVRERDRRDLESLINITITEFFKERDAEAVKRHKVGQLEKLYIPGEYDDYRSDYYK